MKQLLFLLSMILPAGTLAQSVTYNVTFTGSWTNLDSSSYPSNAHFTELVGATHSANNALWERRGVASPGIEAVAETGFIQELLTEIANNQNSETSGPPIVFDDLFNLPNSTSREIEFTEENTNISLISMIAPSPDWFVGLTNISLKENDTWIDNLVIDLHPYDAGTENGTQFTLNNLPTLPQQRIRLLSNTESPFLLASPVIGQISFELMTKIEPPISFPNPKTTNTAQITPILNLLLN